MTLLGQTQRFAYDTVGNFTSKAGVAYAGYGAGAGNSGHAHAPATVGGLAYTYDGMGRVTRVRDAAGNAADTAYTTNSNVQQRTDQAGQIATYGYDSRNNLTSAQLPTGATTWAYADGAHPYAPTKRTDPQGNSVTYGYSASGNPATATNGLSAQNQYQNAYNSNGTLASTTDSRGNVTGYGYDARGNLTSVTPPTPLGGTAITYDTLSRSKTMQDGKGQVTTYTYDALDRVTQIAYAGGAQVAYGYDADNLTSLTDNTGTTGFGYDRLNPPISKTLPGGGPLGYAYDGVGNLTSFTDSGGTVTYAYNAVNLLQTLTEPGDTVKITGRPRGWLGVRYSAHARTDALAHLQAPALPSCDHWSRGLAVLPLRPQVPRCGGATRRARHDLDARDGAPVVSPVRPGRRERTAPSATAARRHVAPRRGVHPEQRSAARSLAGGRPGRQRARYPGAAPARSGRRRALPAAVAQGPRVRAAGAGHRQARQLRRGAAGDPAGGGASAAHRLEQPGRACAPTHPRARATDAPLHIAGARPALPRRLRPDRRALPPTPPPPIARSARNALPPGGRLPASRRWPERRATGPHHAPNPHRSTRPDFR